MANYLGSFTSYITESSVGDLIAETLVGAARGAVVGGITSALTGGEFKDGAKIGAVAGAVAGGGKSLYDNWDSLSGSAMPQKLDTVNQITGSTTASSGGLLDGADLSGSSFLSGNDNTLASNDGFSLDKPATNGLLTTPVDTSLNLGGSSDKSFIDSLKSGFQNMTPAQGKFYGEILKGIGTGVLSMEQAKEAKKLADQEYERSKRKINPTVAAGFSRTPVPTVGRQV